MGNARAKAFPKRARSAFFGAVSLWGGFALLIPTNKSRDPMKQQQKSLTGISQDICLPPRRRQDRNSQHTPGGEGVRKNQKLGKEGHVHDRNREYGSAWAEHGRRRKSALNGKGGGETTRGVVGFGLQLPMHTCMGQDGIWLLGWFGIGHSTPRRQRGKIHRRRTT